jgi:hypothetical protein
MSRSTVELDRDLCAVIRISYVLAIHRPAIFGAMRGGSYTMASA